MIKSAIIISITITSSLLCSNSHAEIYKWIDDKGGIHFSDKLAADDESEKIDIKVIPASPSSPSANPNSSDTSSLNAPNHNSTFNKIIVMYGTVWCPYCKKARNYFKKKGLAFTEYDVEKNPSHMREFKKLGGTGYPLIMIGNKQKMHGFSIEGFEKRYSSM